MGRKQSIESIVYRRFSKENPYRSIEGNPKQERVARIVENMERKLGHPESRMFYRKCAWHMSEDEIYTRIELANRKRIKNHLAYFITLANNLLKERGC